MYGTDLVLSWDISECDLIQILELFHKDTHLKCRQQNGGHFVQIVMNGRKSDDQRWGLIR